MIIETRIIQDIIVICTPYISLLTNVSIPSGLYISIKAKKKIGRTIIWIN